MTNQTFINWQTGIIKENEPTFIDFNNFLKELGLNIAFTQFSNSNYLSIFVFSLDDVEKTKEISSNLSSKIIDTFFSIANSYGQILKYKRAEWKDYSINNIYSFEIACIEKLVRDCKQQFANEINIRLNLNPKYVFCHSGDEQNYSLMPAYYIVFDNPNELTKVDATLQKSIADICNELIGLKDKTGFYTRNKVEIKYFDTITHSDSLYGMSRED